MNRSNRQRQYNRGFVSGGIYNANQQPRQQQQQQPWKQQQSQQEGQQDQQHQLQYQQQQQQQDVGEQQPEYIENQQTLDASEIPNALLEQQQQQEQDMENTEGVEAIADQMAVDTNNFDNGKVPFKKIFQTRKKSSERAREKKIRQNRQLRKAILPKNALMALNELKGVIISDFNINSNVGGGFTAVVTVNDKPYEGRGSSKMSAKSSACEKALRDFILAKMVAKNRKKFAQTLNQAASAFAIGNGNGTGNGSTVNLAAAEGGASVGATQTGGGGGGMGVGGGDGEIEQMDTTDDVAHTDYDNPEDEVPMINLASFALFKLFSEWEKEGYVVPEMHPQPLPNSGSDNGSVNGGNATLSPKEPKKAPSRSDLPPNWETMHPATLLCMMRPGISYVDCGVIGEKPNVLQRLGVTVDEQEFIAQGRSKKIARRNVAVKVCNKLFNTNFSVVEE